MDSDGVEIKSGDSKVHIAGDGSKILNTPEKPSWRSDKKKQRLVFGIGVNGLIIGGVLVNVFYFRFCYMEENDIQAQLYISIAFLILIMYTYFKASWTSPEPTNVDQYFNMNLDKINNSSNMSKKPSLVNLDPKRFSKKCEFCDKIKFERTSHCRICKICVLRRDHHCVWIGNCVGYGNNQYFLNFLICICAGLFIYLYNCFFFFWNLTMIGIKYESARIGFLTGLILFCFSFVQMTVFFSVFGILGQQIFYTFNDLTYLEKKKVFHTESHYCCMAENNEYSANNAYNKGFILHFYEVVGPTLFHLFFPIPKFQKVAIVENKPLFQKVKQPHPFTVHNYMKAINVPGGKELWDEQVKAMDPDNFIQLSYVNYGDKTIL